MDATKTLTPRERATLAALTEAFQPALTAESGDDPVLFAATAAQLGVPEAAEQAIALLASQQRAELRQLLALLDSGLVGLGLTGTMLGATRMTLAQRERLLLALANSSIPQLRSGFQALKRLANFLSYSVTDSLGDNVTWAAIGYRPSPLPPPGPAALRIRPISTPTTLDCDVCVVGSGAGGGVVAADLAARGIRVIVLEAGPGDQAADFSQRELESTQRLFLDAGLTATRDLSVSILAGACLGGGTAINWQTSLRTPDNVRDEWSENSGCSVFIDDRFTRATEMVWARSGVSTDESVVNANNAPLRRGCESLGYEWSPIARNSRDCDATQCGYCTFGCRVGGKQATTVTFLADAQRCGDTTIVANCAAQGVTMANGRVTGVSAIARDGRGWETPVTIRAPIVVVAAGGIQSPALLLRSGLTLPQLGRNLFLHPTSAIAGLYADRVEAWTGPPQSIVSNHFAAVSGNYGFRLETAPTHPGLLALAMPWTGARAHRRLMQRCARASAIIALTRDASGGQVRVRRDGTAVIDYRPGRAEQRLIAQGIAAATRVHLAAGAEEVLTLHTRGLSLRQTSATTARDVDAFCERLMREPLTDNRSLLFSAHQMGTCRMGRDARTAVCDENGQVFGVRGLFVADASAFPASSGVNPMITVMALAKCVAEGIS
ncbi:MAG: GMC family oxidoreductase N-terminal domain-containing protein [Deltaproteobacteria bacterium]